MFLRASILPCLLAQQLNLNTLWTSIQDLGTSFIRQIPYIFLGILIFLAFVVAAKVVSKILTETVYLSELAGSSVNFTVYFWVESKQATALAVSDRVATGIKLALDEAKIDMPFPHTVVLFHDETTPPRKAPSSQMVK